MKLALFLLLSCAFHVFGADLHIRFAGQIFRVLPTHLYGAEKCAESCMILSVSALRDLTLIPVKNPSNPVFEAENPSNLSVKTKIKLKIDGKVLTGKITAVDEYYYETDILFVRGYSGKIVCDMTDRPVGIVSHFISSEGVRKNRVVRIDNLSIFEFEKIKSSDLLKDRRVFSSIKEHEYKLVDGLKKCADADEARNFLLRNAIKRKQYIGWKSTYLKIETIKSQINTQKLYKGFCR